MTSNPIRVGIVGAHPSRGWALTTHLPALRALKNYHISAVGNRTRETAAEAAQVFGAGSYFTDPLELVRSSEVDLVTVCVRVPQHLEVVLAALQAGKHVYCEWPLGRNLEEFRAMRAAARTSGVHHVIGLQGRMDPAIERARCLVAEGAIGQVLSARMYSTSQGWGPVVSEAYAYTFDANTGATLLSIAGGHSLDALCRILGKFDDVTALVATQRRQVRVADRDAVIEPTSPDNVAVIGRHMEGAISSSYVAGGGPKHGAFRLDIIGTSGELLLQAGESVDYQKTPLTLTGSCKKIPLEPFSSSGDPSVPDGLGANVARMYRGLGEDIASTRINTPSFDDAFAMAALLDTVQRSSDTGTRLGVANVE